MKWWINSIIAGLMVCGGIYVVKDIKDVLGGLIIGLGIIILVKTINTILKEKE